MKKNKKMMVMMVPYPAQGHVTPMLQLASAFVRHGQFHPVVVTPDFIHRKITTADIDHNSISFLSVPFAADDEDDTSPRDFFAIEAAMENIMPIHLENLVRKLLLMGEEEEEDGGGSGAGGKIIACMVIDLLASWAIKVANRCGVPVAGFWPVMLSAYRLIAAIPQMVRSGIISETGNPHFKVPIYILPGKPKLGPEDLPWMIGNSLARVSRFKFWIRTLDRLTTLRWLLVNSSPNDEDDKYKEEAEEEFCGSKRKNKLIDDFYHDSPFIFPIGPLSKHALVMSKSTSFWEEDMSCLDWLDKQRCWSVVYVSFGSWVSPIEEGKITSLALALEASGRPFIWVLGLSWREGLPIGYVERVSKQGKVVSWAPQMEVLKHEGVGCYLTHCGWNSTMEAIQCMKPMVCFPIAGDQFLNCAYIVEVWQIGVKIRGFGQKDVEEGFKKVMEDSKMKESLLGLHERIMGNEASSSATNYLTTFIDDLQTSRN